MGTPRGLIGGVVSSVATADHDRGAFVLGDHSDRAGTRRRQVELLRSELHRVRILAAASRIEHEPGVGAGPHALRVGVVWQSTRGVDGALEQRNAAIMIALNPKSPLDLVGKHLMNRGKRTSSLELTLPAGEP